VALVSAIFAAPDVELACRELRALSDAMVRGQAGGEKHGNGIDHRRL